MESDCAFRAVYRLDRDTSGLVLIAKNELAASKLAGKIKKDYYAIVKGKFEGEGTIDLPIRRVRESIIERGVFDDGERAITHYTAIKTDGESTLLRLNLETGRTHQIRVHFAHLGSPLLGDTLYGGDCAEINRQALHCKTIYFTHPITNEKITVDSDFPDDFKGLI
jgi:23S rRNA pseudouridine1911/1915/1917 synthase